MNFLKSIPASTMVAIFTVISLGMTVDFARAKDPDSEVSQSRALPPPPIEGLRGFEERSYLEMNPAVNARLNELYPQAGPTLTPEITEARSRSLREIACNTLVDPDSPGYFWVLRFRDDLNYEFDWKKLAQYNEHLEHEFLRRYFPSGLQAVSGITEVDYRLFFARWLQDVVNAVTRRTLPVQLETPINWNFTGLAPETPWTRLYYLVDEHGQALKPGGQILGDGSMYLSTDNTQTIFTRKRMDTSTTEAQYEAIQRFRNTNAVDLGVFPVDFRRGERAFDDLEENDLGALRHINLAPKYLTLGDGLCGFHALGISSEEFVDYCRRLLESDDNAAKERVYRHIYLDVTNVMARLDGAHSEENLRKRRAYFAKQTFEEYMQPFRENGEINNERALEYLANRYVGDSRWEGGMLEGTCIDLVAEAANVNYILVSDQPRQGVHRANFVGSCLSILDSDDEAAKGHLRRWIISKAQDLRDLCLNITSTAEGNSCRYQFEAPERANAALQRVFGAPDVAVPDANGLVGFGGSLTRASTYNEFMPLLRDHFQSDNKVRAFFEARFVSSDFDWFAQNIEEGYRIPHERADWTREEFIPLPSDDNFCASLRAKHGLKPVHFSKRTIRSGEQAPNRKTVWLHLPPGHYSTLIPVITPEYIQAKYGANSELTPYEVLCRDFGVNTYFKQTCLEEVAALARRGKIGKYPDLGALDLALRYARHLQRVYHTNAPLYEYEFASEIRAALYHHRS